MAFSVRALLRPLVLLLAGLLLTSRLAHGQAPAPGYAELSRLTVGRGSVILYADARLSPALRDSLWEETSPCLLDADHPLRRFCQTNLDTLRPAVVLWAPASGAPAAPVQLTKALAKIDLTKLNGLVAPTIFVTEADQPDFGTYRGPVTRLLLLPQHGPTRWASVRELGKDATSRELHLVDAGKTQWTVDGGEIRVIQCQPRAVGDSVVFDLTLRRLRPLNTGDWEQVSETREGFWEADMGMPEARAFPDWPS